jgi:hypothetical protein
MPRQAPLDFDKLIALCQTKEQWDNRDREALKEFREALGPPTEIAQALGISVATLHYWEKQESAEKELRPPPSERQLRKFSDVLAQRHLQSVQSKPGFYDVLLRMRNVGEIMERATVCSKFWVIRSGRPFLAGTDPKMLEFMINFMIEKETISYFVFRSPKDIRESGREFEAKMSFDAMLMMLTSHSRGALVRPRIRAGLIETEETANRVGLSDPWISFAMAEYSPEGYRKFQRSVDVWMEFIFDTGKDPQKPEPQPVWLELPQNEALLWRERRIEILREAAARGASLYPADK